MRKKIWLVSMVSLLVSILVSAQMNIWYVPHPDDEIIGMGGAIRSAVLRGDENKVVIITQGKASKVRKLFALSKNDFGAARSRESLEALEIIGVKKEDIVILDIDDGKLSIKEAERIIQSFVEGYPGAIHNTVSLFDVHKDHQNLAKALYRVGLKYDKLDINFYRVYIYRSLEARYPTKTVQVIEVEDFENKVRALESFTKFAPENGRYSIGKLSVPDLIMQAALTPYEYKDDYLNIPASAYTNNIQTTIDKARQTAALLTLVSSFSILTKKGR